MDINTALLTGAGTILCGVLVAIIFIFGFKEKTFEEALDEQRRGELIELIRGDKVRPKKPKKASKKTKEKLAINEGKSVKDIVQHSEPEAEKPTHVEFKFPEAEVVSERPLAPIHQQEDAKKKRNKRDKVKPILHNKEEHSPLAENVSEPPPANHFAETHPKDDVLLKRSHSREDISSPSSEEPISDPDEIIQQSRVQKVEKAPSKPIVAVLIPKVNGAKPAAGKVALNSDAKAVVGKLALSTPAAPVAQSNVAVVPTSLTTAQIPTPPPAPVIAPVVIKDRKKKKGDLATLQQMIGKDTEGVTMSLLLPLVRKAELSRSEVHQLIEQLLNREQGGGTEWMEGRQDPMVRLKKQLAEKEKALAEEQQGVQAAHAKLVQVRAEMIAERQRQGAAQRQFEEQLNAKQSELQAITSRLQVANETNAKTVATVQQVQSQLAEEKKKVRKLMDEQTAAQNQSLVAQELELRLQTTTKMHQEEVSTLQGQLAGMQNEVSELQERLQEQKTCQEERQGEVVARELECERLHQQLVHLETHLEQVNSVASERDTELDEAYHSQDELVKRVQTLESQLDLSEKVVTELNEKLKAALNAPPPAVSAPSDVPDLRSRIEDLEDIINSRDALVSKLQLEHEEQKKSLSQLQSELDSQRDKNNELRTKNWKAMEAVSSAEKNLQDKQKECDRLVRDTNISARQEEQAALRELLQRIFPSVPCPDTQDHKAWVAKFENAAQQWLASELSAASEQQHQQTSVSQGESTKHVLEDLEKQNTELQGMVTHYKFIIEDTEGILKKLERHVEEEETRWRRQLQLKDEELIAVTVERDTLRSELQQSDHLQQQNENTDEMEKTLIDLENKLRHEKELRSTSQAQAQQLQSRLDEIAAQVKVLEQVKEERDTLAMQLAKESSHSQHLTLQVKKLEETVAQRAGTNHVEPSKSKDQSNVTTNGPSIEPSISEKKPLKRRGLQEWFRKKVSPRKRRLSVPDSFKQS